MSAAATALEALGPATPHSAVEQLEHLVKHKMPRCYKQAFRQLGNWNDAEDAVKDALVSAYKNLSRFKGTARLSTRFTAIVTNAARMQRGRIHSVVSFAEQLSPGDGSLMLLGTFEDSQDGPATTSANAEFRYLALKVLTSSHQHFTEPFDSITWTERPLPKHQGDWEFQ